MDSTPLDLTRLPQGEHWQHLGPPLVDALFAVVRSMSKALADRDCPNLELHYHPAEMLTDEQVALAKSFLTEVIAGGVDLGGH